MSVTQPGHGASHSSALEAARSELRGGCACAARAAERRSSATPIASTRMLRQLFAEVGGAGRAGRGAGARRLRPPASLSPLGHRSAVLFGGRIGATKSVPARVPAPAVGSRRRRRPSGARARRLHAARDRQPGVPAGAARRAAGGRRARRCSIGFGALFHTAATHAYILQVAARADRASATPRSTTRCISSSPT